MNKLVTIIDYNVGNILNVARAFKHVGCEVSVVEKPDEINVKTNLLVLPGVGAFGSGMSELENRGFVDFLCKYNAQQMPLMGICLGMQMLFDSSKEMGEHKGLSFLSGKIDKIPNQIINNKKYPVPHIGWKRMSSSIDQDLNNGVVYFVHSYYVNEVDNKNLISYVRYGDIKIPAVVRNGNTVGFQFHPEKSGVYGLEMLRRFVNDLT